jgi:hypothetical protein
MVLGSGKADIVVERQLEALIELKNIWLEKEKV